MEITKPLDDPRLQEMFSAAIDGALTSGYQGVAPAPAGHWLEYWWQKGRAVAEAEPMLNGLTESETSATASVAGLSGPANLGVSASPPRSPVASLPAIVDAARGDRYLTILYRLPSGMDAGPLIRDERARRIAWGDVFAERDSAKEE